MYYILSADSQIAINEAVTNALCQTDLFQSRVFVVRLSKYPEHK
jgi:hypothetical protein